MRTSLTDEAQRIVLVLKTDEQLKTCSLVLRNPLSFKVVSSYSNLNDAMAMLKKDMPSLIIVDPDYRKDWNAELDLIVDLKSKFRNVKILILTNTLDFESLNKSFQAGATGYILYEDGVKCLYDAVVEILGGGTPLSKKVVKLLVNSFQITTDSLLSKRELAVLREVATGKAYSYVANTLNISVDTVRTHIQHIFEKLNVSNKSEALIKAREEKLV